MSKTYKPYQPDQDFLLPPSLKDWLPEKHLAYFVSEVVEELDLSGIYAVYERDERGQPPYDPRMMTKLLVYGYCVGVYSARKIQQRLIEDVAFRVLAAGNEPDFRTIADFRKIHLQVLKGLFEQVLKVALEMGAVKLGRVALDGSKIKANASKHKAMSYDRMVEQERAIRKQVKEMLARAEAADAEEDRRYGKDRAGDELPKELQRPEAMIADSGYGSEKNLEHLESEKRPERRIEAFIATERQKHGEREVARRGPLPKGATRVERMKRKLLTKVGASVYAARKGIVEPVFGQIKQGRGFRGFSLRGFEKVKAEWALVCATHNLLKMYRVCWA